jgi:hypothetical protein
VKTKRRNIQTKSRARATAARKPSKQYRPAMLFQVINGRPAAHLPFSPSGRPVEPDGVTVLTLDQAAEKFPSISRDNLVAEYEAVLGSSPAEASGLQRQSDAEPIRIGRQVLPKECVPTLEFTLSVLRQLDPMWKSHSELMNSGTGWGEDNLEGFIGAIFKMEREACKLLSADLREKVRGERPDEGGE